MELKTIPFNPDEKGIIFIKGVGEREAKRIIEQIKDWLASQEPKLVIWTGSPDVSIEFIKIDNVENKDESRPNLQSS